MGQLSGDRPPTCSFPSSSSSPSCPCAPAPSPAMSRSRSGAPPTLTGTNTTCPTHLPPILCPCMPTFQYRHLNPTCRRPLLLLNPTCPHLLPLLTLHPWSNSSLPWFTPPSTMLSTSPTTHPSTQNHTIPGTCPRETVR